MESAIDKVSKRIEKGEEPVLVATSGTAMAIGTLISNKENHIQSKLQGYKIPKNNLSIASIGAILDDFDFDIKLRTVSFKFKVPGRKSEFYNIDVRGSNITDESLKSKIVDKVIEHLGNISPAYTKLNKVDSIFFQDEYYIFSHNTLK